MPAISQQRSKDVTDRLELYYSQLIDIINFIVVHEDMYSFWSHNSYRFNNESMLVIPLSKITLE